MSDTNQSHSNTMPFSRIPFLPLLRTLIRQKYTFTMLVLQIALTLAVLSNGLFIVSQRLDILQRPTGIDETHTFALTSSGFTQSFNPQNSIKADLDALRQMPNIVNAVATYAFPFSGSSEWDELQTSTGQDEITVPAASYKLDEHGIEALGLTLLAGENFNTNEVLWQTQTTKTFPSAVIITSKLASDLFNTTDWSTVVGKTIYINATYGAVIKGVVEQLQAPWDAVGKIENSIIYPRVITRNSARYFIRTQANKLQETMVEVEDYLATSNQQRMIRKVQSIQTIKKQVYGPDIGAISILMVVIFALSIVAALGIAGLTSFNLVKRKKQIGIRRALGANKTDILSYFIAENIIQSTCGVLLGWLLALGLNVFLVSQYALPKLPLSYVVIAALCLYILGILAILKPAIKAMNISPALATRDQ
ncbi:ABC transporter permease [Paraglaciecola arctica]|uniref:ABC transporter permease n=1 Tax=Paraglaciecola arctica TaxID=1128911 RepID=UPI001C068BBF|nr:FtsX-like permease family protein [Paraglaciecola arctica]MBU3002683.1 FtsX-like permease family protein [Paraglaciecola arctica]